MLVSASLFLSVSLKKATNVLKCERDIKFPSNVSCSCKLVGWSAGPRSASRLVALVRTVAEAAEAHKTTSPLAQHSPGGARAQPK